MLQESHKIYWESDRPTFVEAVKKVLWQKKHESEERQDRAVYIHLLFRMLCGVTATQVREAIAEIMPDAVVTGMAETLFGDEDPDSVLRMNITYLRCSKVETIE